MVSSDLWDHAGCWMAQEHDDWHNKAEVYTHQWINVGGIWWRWRKPFIIFLLSQLLSNYFRKFTFRTNITSFRVRFFFKSSGIRKNILNISKALLKGFKLIKNTFTVYSTKSLIFIKINNNIRYNENGVRR